MNIRNTSQTHHIPSFDQNHLFRFIKYLDINYNHVLIIPIEFLLLSVSTRFLCIFFVNKSSLCVTFSFKRQKWLFIPNVLFL